MLQIYLLLSPPSVIQSWSRTYVYMYIVALATLSKVRAHVLKCLLEFCRCALSNTTVHAPDKLIHFPLHYIVLYSCCWTKSPQSFPSRKQKHSPAQNWVNYNKRTCMASWFVVSDTLASTFTVCLNALTQYLAPSCIMHCWEIIENCWYCFPDIGQGNMIIIYIINSPTPCVCVCVCVCNFQLLRNGRS